MVYTAAQIVISTLYKITHEYGIMAHCTAAIGICSADNFTVQLWQRTKMQCRALPVVICMYRVFFLTGTPPKKIKYGKPRLGVSMLT